MRQSAEASGPWADVPGLEGIEGQGSLVVPLPAGAATAFYRVEARLD